MALDADFLVDRRRLKRRLSFWRVVAILALIVAVIAAVGRFTGFEGGAYIARYEVNGVIVDDPDRRDTLAEIAEDDDVKALILRVDSPGGTVIGGEELFRSLRKIGDRKPVVAVMGGLATSAGYMAAIAAEQVYARRGTITGSIGVIMQTTEITGLLEMLGISAEAVRSGPLKARPSPFEEMDDDAREAMQSMIADTHRMFLDMVRNRRGLSGSDLAAVSDGRVFTGAQALSAKLIDGLGGEDEARAWLSSEKGLSTDLRCAMSATVAGSRKSSTGPPRWAKKRFSQNDLHLTVS